MTTTNYLINDPPFQALDCIDGEPDTHQVGCKNVEYRHMEVNPFCRTVIDRMMSYVTTFKKYQYVFVRVCDEVYTNGFWHLDSSLNPVDEYENFLFVTGAYRTEFVMNPMRVTHCQNVIEFNTQVDAQEPIIQSLPANTICRYKGSNAHRRPPIGDDEKRLLIRLSNTDVKLTQYRQL